MLPKCAFTGEVKDHFKESSDDFSLFNKDTFISPLVITKEIFDLACSKEKVKKYQKELDLDKNLEKDKKIGVHPNENTATIFISTADIEKIIKEHGNDVNYISL